MKITNRNSLYNAVNKLIRIYNRRIRNRRNFEIYKITEGYEEVFYKQSIEEKKIINSIREYLKIYDEYLKIYDYDYGIDWEKTTILKGYAEYVEDNQSSWIWIEETTSDYSEDSYYGTITIKIPKNKKYVLFYYYI